MVKVYDYWIAMALFLFSNYSVEKKKNGTIVAKRRKESTQLNLVGTTTHGSEKGTKTSFAFTAHFIHQHLSVGEHNASFHQQKDI